MDTLDEKGKKLYNDYIKARNKWTTYISPKVTEYFQKTLKDANKEYYRFNYLFFKNITDDLTSCDITNKPENLKKLYRKLSLLFHPDKFKTNDSLFKFIKNLYDSNNLTKISKINDDIDMLLDYNSDMIDKYIMTLEGKNIVTEQGETVDVQDYDYTTTLAYIMFIKNQINLNDYYTPEELINHIENDHITESEMQYYTMNNDDPNIKIGIEKRIIRLKRENTIMKEKLAQSMKQVADAEEKIRLLNEQNKQTHIEHESDSKKFD